MKPVTTGKVLIAIGCLLMFRALTMSISIGSFGGYEIPNIHLMNQRQILLFLGGFLFLGGLVLYSANKRTRRARTCRIRKRDGRKISKI
jgi:hypothetical protein